MAEGLIGSYVDDLVERGQARTAGVERAFRAVPRHWFVERFWVRGREYACEVEGNDWSAEALELVYSDEALITRRDDDRSPTSSASQPSVVAMMLEALDLAPGMRVLEIGAGTGYNAALMAEMVGDASLVTTIDIDPDVVAQTRRLLARAGYGGVRVVEGDGALGDRESGPFDRIVATVGCSDVSWAWVDQLRPDGLLLLPLDYGGSHPLVKLRVVEPGRLAGCIEGWTGFMRIQGDMAEAAPWPSRFPDFGGRPPDEVRPLFPALGRVLAKEPADVDRRTEWWRVPSAWYDFYFCLSLIDRRAYRGPEGLGLVDADGASAVMVRPDGVCVWGRSALPTRLEAACARWEGLGMPELGSWGMEFAPRAAAVPDFEESEGVFVVERGRSIQKVRGERAEE
ncbi:MAG: methyltransferase domain-containing protein [Chloroflexota bacterium]|nr:methyltransferase domain-containing protein [Chloroflexota bacterium]